MSDTNTTKPEVREITFDKDIAPLVQELGLSVKELASFYKLTGDRGTKAVYVSKTKRKVTRVDISGVEVKHPAIRPPAKKNGKVTGQVQMAHEEAMDAITASLKVLVNGEIVGTKRVPEKKEPVTRESLRAKVRAIASGPDSQPTPDDAARALAKKPKDRTGKDLEAIAADRLSKVEREAAGIAQYRKERAGEAIIGGLCNLSLAQ